MPPTVVLKKGHVRPVWSGHPWVFSQAIERVEGGARAGDEVRVVDPQGNALGRGFFSPRSAIPVRLLTRSDEPIDAGLVRRRIEDAIRLRESLGFPVREAGRETDAYRVVHAEGDRLPGLVVDRLGDVLAVQLGTAGLRVREAVILDVLIERFHPRAIVDRTPRALAELEGVELPRPRDEHGILWGDADVTHLGFHERGLAFEIPLSLGQKTGFYCDQRPLRARVEKLARGKRVLDAYSYVGAFALGAKRGGASHVLAVDESGPALSALGASARANGLEIEVVRSDARHAMERASRDGGFDLVLCDPPKLAPSKGSRDGALGVYRNLAASACRATTLGGTLVMSSCSGAVSLDELTRALAMGARDANVGVVVLERFFQGADHPVPAAFPEGLYLKSLIARVERL